MPLASMLTIDPVNFGKCTLWHRRCMRRTGPDRSLTGRDSWPLGSWRCELGGLALAGDDTLPTNGGVFCSARFSVGSGGVEGWSPGQGSWPLGSWPMGPCRPYPTWPDRFGGGGGRTVDKGRAFGGGHAKDVMLPDMTCFCAAGFSVGSGGLEVWSPGHGSWPLGSWPRSPCRPYPSWPERFGGGGGRTVDKGRAFGGGAWKDAMLPDREQELRTGWRQHVASDERRRLVTYLLPCLPT